ncbi:transcription antitermination protein nusG [Ruminococcaceae bacterium YRB3002]|nr:transcription antitermination protein nusG [Ruminococcaceae bacterium YRB3002]
MPEEREARWYVIHTYSGYEKSVKDTLERYVENHAMGEKIQEVMVPEERYVEVKDGERKEKTRNKFPGYVLVKLVFGYEEKEDKSLWYFIRNVRGVTGFVGPDPNKPLPLTDSDLASMGIETDWKPEVDYDVGDYVRIISGAFAEFKGNVSAMDYEKEQVTIEVQMFGRITPTTVSFTQVQKVP